MMLKVKNIVILIIVFIIVVIVLCFINYKNTTGNITDKLCKKYDYYLIGEVNNNKLYLSDIVYCLNQKEYKYKSINLSLYIKKDNTIEELDNSFSNSDIYLSDFIKIKKLNMGNYKLSDDLYVEIKLTMMDDKVEIFNMPVVEKKA